VDRKRVWTTVEIGLLKIVAGFIANIYRIREKEDFISEKLENVEKLNKLMIGREMRMLELKEKIRKLEK
jgi:hypothetical protein